MGSLYRCLRTLVPYGNLFQRRGNCLGSVWRPILGLLGGKINDDLSSALRDTDSIHQSSARQGTCLLLDGAGSALLWSDLQTVSIPGLIIPAQLDCGFFTVRFVRVPFSIGVHIHEVHKSEEIEHIHSFIQRIGGNRIATFLTVNRNSLLVYY